MLKRKEKLPEYNVDAVILSLKCLGDWIKLTGKEIKKHDDSVVSLIYSLNHLGNGLRSLGDEIRECTKDIKKVVEDRTTYSEVIPLISDTLEEAKCSLSSIVDNNKEDVILRNADSAIFKNGYKIKACSYRMLQGSNYSLLRGQKISQAIFCNIDDEHKKRAIELLTQHTLIKLTPEEDRFLEL